MLLPRILVVALLTQANAVAQVIEVASRPGAVPTKTLLVPASNAKATVLLFPGGGGMLNLRPDGSTASAHTFVRSIDLWQQYGINAVLVDSPDELGNTRSHSRLSRDHQARIAEVVTFYQDRFRHPIWLFGHSMGTTSVTGYANLQKGKPAGIEGIILAGTNNTATLDRDVILPTLAIHHRNDGCRFDPVRNSESIVGSRQKSVRTKLALMDGGSSAGDPCGAQSFHGFLGLEKELIEVAANFILGP
jgi:pimeloyl-ACP methyl ester carboxylesterase